ALGLDSAPLVEWHGGQRWYRVAPNQAEHLRGAARAAGGSATLFIAPPASGTGAAARFVPKFDTLSAPLARIHQALKHEFDPHRIFNRGRLYPEI
ncbi:MAG: glycolate oxidase subunit GlcE, partial [Variovorax sp.]